MQSGTMGHEDRKALVAELVETLNRRGPLDAGLDRSVARLWPGGPADRSESSAREWLRRWAPKRLEAAPPVCGCAHGQCAVCN